MKINEAIDKRISRRSYESKPLTKEHVFILQDFIDDLNRQSGLSIKIILDAAKAFKGITKSYGMFSGVTSLFTLVGEKNDENLWEKAGYFGELLVLKATALGLGTCWVGSSYDKKSFACDIVNNEVIVCVITVGYAVQTKSIKERIIHSTIHRKSKNISGLCEYDKQPPNWFWDGMNSVLNHSPLLINNRLCSFIKMVLLVQKQVLLNTIILT